MFQNILNTGLTLEWRFWLWIVDVTWRPVLRKTDVQPPLGRPVSADPGLHGAKLRTIIMTS